MADLSRYDAIRDSIQFGDVAIFSGYGGYSDVIKNVTFSDYSHVGIMLWMAPVINEPARLFIAESTTLNTVADIDGTYRRGTQIVPMSQRLDSYKGKAWISRLKPPLDNKEKLNLVDWLMQRHADKVPYDEVQAVLASIDKGAGGVGGFLANILGCRSDNRADLKKLFCSELVTAALQHIGRVDKGINPSEMLPRDVASFTELSEPELILDEPL